LTAQCSHPLCRKDAMLSEAKIAECIEETRKELESASGEVLQQYPIQRYLDSIRNYPKFENYFGLSTVVREFCERIERKYDARTQALYQKLMILTLLKGSLGVVQNGEFPGSVVALCLDYYERMVSALLVKNDGYYTHRNEAFIDDICCCSLKTIPLGKAWMLETAAVRKKLLVTGGVRQFLACSALFLCRLRGFAPFYRIHMLKRPSGGFDPEERIKCYLRIAELLKRNPDVKGMYLLGWFYDPKLADISPELAYLREIPERGGARRFRYGPTEQAIRLATAWSAERKKLYEEGKYMPTEHALIWPRKEILHWASERAKDEEAAS